MIGNNSHTYKLILLYAIRLIFFKSAEVALTLDLLFRLLLELNIVFV